MSILERNAKGYFLIVEGARIDHGHHAGNAFRALSETTAFSDAVRVAVESSSEADTLIVVTADHSHTLSFMGYARRGNPILGKVIGSSSENVSGEFAKDALGLPYTTLSYASGPGYSGASDSQAEGTKRFPHLLKNPQPASGRPDLAQVDTEHPDYLQQSPMPLRSETHGGDDVGVWARGPGSAAVRGSIEQNVIFHLMTQAQPEIAKLLCKAGGCEHGVPVGLPTEASLRKAKPAQAR